MRSKTTFLLCLLAALTLGLLTPAYAATWQVSLALDANPASIEQLDQVPDGPLWMVGGMAVSDAYDAPFAWRRSSGGWKAYRIPVDLTNRWGYLNGIDSSAADDAWAVGQVNQVSNGNTLPLVAHWNGARWGIVDQPWVTTGGTFTAVTARAADDVWAFGGDSFGSSSLTPMAWHFDGFTWARMELPLRNANCVQGYDTTVTAAEATADGVYVAINCTTGTFKLAGTVMYFDGRRWQAVLRLDGGSIVLGLGADPAGKLWAVGATVPSGGVTRTAAWAGGPDGLTAVAVPTGASFSVLNDVASDGATVVMAGEESTQNGPVSLFIMGPENDLTIQDVPFDRQLSATEISRGRIWVGGPSFGGWLGSQAPNATVLTRRAGSP